MYQAAPAALINLGAKLAKDWAIPLKEHKPDWVKHGKSAGFVRNELIVSDADIVFAFWDGKSKGTAHDIQLAKKQNKELHICYFQS